MVVLDGVHVALGPPGKLLESASNVKHPWAGLGLRASPEVVSSRRRAGGRNRVDGGARKQGDQEGERVHLCRRLLPGAKRLLMTDMTETRISRRESDICR